MTIIKKRGRIVRNIFVIDRYDVPTGCCWEEMLSRMYSVNPNVPNRMSDVSNDRFQIRKLRNQSEKLSRAIIV